MLRIRLRESSKSRLFRSVNSHNHSERKRSKYHRLERNLNRGARKLSSQRSLRPRDENKLSSTSQSTTKRPSIPYYRDLNREGQRLREKYGISLLERYPKAIENQSVRICRSKDRSQAGHLPGWDSKDETVPRNCPVNIRDLYTYDT